MSILTSPGSPHRLRCENMADEVNSKANPSNAPQNPAGALESLAAAAHTATPGLPPVHLWNPPDCGDIGLKITSNGTWLYQGSPIGRKPLVRLFSTILRKDADGYFLVTPIEKISIEVADAPFMAMEMSVLDGPDGPTLRFRTNVDDEVEAGPDHPLRFESGPASGIKPYVHVRGGLWALLTRALVYDLVERAVPIVADGQPALGISSGGHVFVIGSQEAEQTWRS
ncbi:MAG: hypothetical protein JWL62_1887 [Hyphomicrobiales bacterium]|nr:hypothetical protein [Hyphomicrobiales bacterium]